MVLKNRIKRITGLSVFLIVVVLFSCEKMGLFVDCTRCEADEPIEAQISLRVSTDYGEAYVNIYQGYLEDSILVRSLRTSSETTFYLPVNKNYTFAARYIIAGNVYFAINSITPRVRYVKDQCDDPCYYVYDNEVDLRLKSWK